MSYATVLHLEPAAEALIYDVWSALAGIGAKGAMLDRGIRPHVTLTSADHIDQQALEAATATFAATLPPLRLTLGHVGVFGTAEGVLFLGVTAQHALLDAHTGYSRIFASHARQLHAYYRTGVWVPHCTLAMGLSDEEVAEALAIARRAPLPVHAMTHEMSLVYVPAAGPVETLAEFQIGRAA